MNIENSGSSSASSFSSFIGKLVNATATRVDEFVRGILPEFREPDPPPLLLPKGIRAIDLSGREQQKEGLPVYVVVTHGENQSVESRVCQEVEDGAGCLYLSPLERSSIDVDPVLTIPSTSPSYASTIEDYERRLSAYKGEIDRPAVADLESWLQDVSCGLPGYVLIEMEEKPPFMMLKEALTGLGRTTKISCDEKPVYNSKDLLQGTLQQKSVWIFSQFLDVFNKQEALTQNLMKLILQSSLSRIVIRLAMMCNRTNFGYYVSHALSNEVTVYSPHNHSTDSLEEYIKIEIKLRFAVINIEETDKPNRFIRVTRVILIDPKDLSEGVAGDGIVMDTYSPFQEHEF